MPSYYSLRTRLLRQLPTSHRPFSTSCPPHAGVTGSTRSRAIIYKAHGDPYQVLEAFEYDLPALQKGQVRVRFDLSAVNPADINVIQGVYPSKPVVRKDLASEPISIMGNEGTAIVEGFQDDGEVESKFKVGDRVVMGAAQLGTWQTHSNLSSSLLIPLPSSSPLTPEQAATLSINPPTAYRMLSDFVPGLNPTTNSTEDSAEGRKKQPWVIQNGANSAVGLAVIQLCRLWGIKTINLVRPRPDLASLRSHLEHLGADFVMTYDEFLDRSTRSKIRGLIGNEGEMRLALNCVGGKETGEMAKLLDQQGVLVTYGGMAKMGLTLPPSLFIFKQLTAKGFWLSNWVQRHPGGRQKMMEDLAALTSSGQLIAPETEVVPIGPSSGLDLEQMGKRVREVMKQQEGGRGKKVLLSFV